MQKTGRIYMLGKKQIIIEKNVIATIQEWNSRFDRQTTKYDELLVKALLLCCVNADDLALGNVGDDVKDLITGMFFREFYSKK